MRKRLPDRQFYALADLKKCWQISRSELQQWLTNGDLKAHVWLPLMSAYKITELRDGSAIKLAPELCHWEGYILFSRHACMRLLKTGEIRVREFSASISGDRYCLPETADDITIKIDDLVILSEERVRFEKAHEFQGVCNHIRPVTLDRSSLKDTQGTYIDPTFKIVTHEGVEHRMGNIQADVLRQLCESAKHGSPWQHGKQLLHLAGSQSYSLSNLFKHKPIWKELIESDGRGLYRIKPSLGDVVSHQ